MRNLMYLDSNGSFEELHESCLRETSFCQLYIAYGDIKSNVSFNDDLPDEYLNKRRIHEGRFSLSDQNMITCNVFQLQIV